MAGGEAQLRELRRFGIIRDISPPPARAAEQPGGFLVFALGSPRYLQLAANCVLTIKARAPERPVALAHDDAALEGSSPDILGRFDQLIACPDSMRTVNGKFAPLFAKLHADRLSLFPTTIVVDADSVFMEHADLDSEFARYRPADFAPALSFTHLPQRTQPIDRIIMSADVAECIQRFGIERPISQCHLYYFGLTDRPATHSLFERARSVYLELVERPLGSMMKWYGQQVSAELSMSIATGLQSFGLYREVHMPMLSNAMVTFEGVWQHYLGFTFCGRPPNDFWQERYDDVVRNAAPAGVKPTLWKEIEEAPGRTAR